MKVISVNVNGIRSAARKGFFDWLALQNADLVCLQEIRAQGEQLKQPDFVMEKYQHHFFPAERRGYSGVGIYCRTTPHRMYRGLGWPCADEEGRYIQLDFGNLSVASLYMPSGTSGIPRQAVKFEYMARYEKRLKADLESGRHMIICGDWNIAHKKIDLRNWRSNQKTSGFLPEEREWMDALLVDGGWVDAFRVVNQEPDQYTWWSNFGRAREQNIGWRIDYQIVTPNVRQYVRSAEIYTAQRFSDHAPLIMTYDDAIKT